MAEIDNGSDVNLAELRGRLTGRVALVPLIAAGGMVLWVLVSSQPISLTNLSVLMVLVGLGLTLLQLVDRRPALARHALVWSFTTGMLIAMALVSEVWLPFAGLMLAFVSGMLISGGQFVTAAVIGAAAAGMNWRGMRTYPLPQLLVALTLDTILTWLVVRTLYTALEWAWEMQQRADSLLEVARDRQWELNNALKSVDVNNVILRRTQRELVNARKQAEEARLMKEQFAANVSHELRTPLNLILGFSEVMCVSSEVYGDMDWPPALRQDVYQIYRSSRHLLEMIDDVLDLSRFEIVGFTLNKETTPLGPLLHDAVEISRGLFRERPIRLEAAIPHDLPVLDIDRIRIRQVLLNLLKNAAHFTDEGVVRVEAARVNGEVLITVSDTGPGVPVDEQPHLFDEFYQVDRLLHRKHGGAGLGLAISKHFVKAHDGRIWVESPSVLPIADDGGPGSTFSFTLPIPGERIPLSHLTMSRPLTLMQSDMRAPVLVVDPDPQVATLVGRHLEGYEALPVDGVGRVAEQIALHHPQAVIYNVLPGERIDQDLVPPAVSMPIVECSLPSQAWVARDLAVTACLNKPVTSERLLQEIARLGDVRDILVVDDDRAFCRLVERILQASDIDCNVFQVYDGSDGLGVLRANRPDLLLLDLVMPGTDGFQVLEEMRRDAQLADVPVVLLTATSLAEDALMQRGGQIVIRRPDGLTPVEVLRCLRAMIDVLEPRYDERSLLESV